MFCIHPLGRDGTFAGDGARGVWNRAKLVPSSVSARHVSGRPSPPTRQGFSELPWGGEEALSHLAPRRFWVPATFARCPATPRQCAGSFFPPARRAGRRPGGRARRLLGGTDVFLEEGGRGADELRLDQTRHRGEILAQVFAQEARHRPRAIREPGGATRATDGRRSPRAARSSWAPTGASNRARSRSGPCVPSAPP